MRPNSAPRPWQGGRQRSTSTARRGPSNIRRTYPSSPVPSGNIFHFNASKTSPGSTVELHPPPRYQDIRPVRQNMVCKQPIRPNNRNPQNGMETAPMMGVKQELDNCQKQIGIKWIWIWSRRCRSNTPRRAPLFNEFLSKRHPFPLPLTPSWWWISLPFIFPFPFCTFRHVLNLEDYLK